jgi:hypothetical protein
MTDTTTDFYKTGVDPQYRLYLQRIAKALVDSYGDTLIEYDTYLTMAEAVIKELLEMNHEDLVPDSQLVLPITSHYISDKAFNNWQKEMRKILYG